MSCSPVKKWVFGRARSWGSVRRWLVVGCRLIFVSDTDGTVHRAWECTLFGLLTRRVTFLIGPDRRIRLAHESNLRMDSHVEAVLRAL